MTRVRFSGPELEGFAISAPAASVRLLIPSPASAALVMPDWNGNEFLLPGGERPVIRTFTPRHFDPDALELDLDVVLHDAGATSAWVRHARAGDAAAVSGPGRGYTIEPSTSAYLLAGDETAIPAISQIIETLSPSVRVHAIVEVAEPDARQRMPPHPGLTTQWVDLHSGEAPGTALLEAIRGLELEPGTRVWVAGEAGGLYWIRKHLFEERGLSRRDVTARGYWKHGR